MVIAMLIGLVALMSEGQHHAFVFVGGNLVS
jgi:hypothetical protein